MNSATYQGIFARARRTVAVGIALLVVVALTADTAWAIKVMTYNLLDYGSGREAQFKTVLSAAQPDVLSVNEMVSQAAATYFLDNVLNGAGGPGGYSLATFQADGTLNNALYYRGATITYAGSSDHTYLPTSPRITDRWRLGLVGGNVPFYVYTMHLHSTDQTSRLTQCTAVRTNMNTLPAGTNFLVCGDFNLDSSTEASYQQLVGSQSNNNGRVWDPINQPGNWASNYAFRAIHTQCTHLDNPGAPPGSVGGGMDDRFDFILISTALQDGAGFDYLTGTYKPFGNDGNHYNVDINDPPVIPEGSAVADALHGASDHLPVVLELTAPAIISVPLSLPYGTMLIGASSPDNQRVLDVQNAASPPSIDLTYTFTTVPSGYTVVGGNGPFTLTAGAIRHHTITLTTAATGFFNGNLVITNNSATSPKYVALSGKIVRHAVPSTDSASQILTAPLGFGSHGVGGFTDQTAQIYNVNYAALQALLQVYAYDITGQDAARFSVPAFSPADVGLTPAAFTVHFNDAGAPSRSYSAALQFSTRDDNTLPGATTLSSITFNLSAEVTGGAIRGDMNGNGAVEPGDITGFVSVLLDPAGATSDQRWLADMNGDGINDGLDCQPFVTSLLTP
jgi:endonuclease/exonuclease/phosphatase family metal-dependent hydrolase